MSTSPNLTASTRLLRDKEVHVLYADLAIGQIYANALLELLDHTEQSRLSRFKLAAHREQFLASHGFLRLALARYVQIEASELRFHSTDSGKPELADKDIRFNLSHTDGAAALAIARNRPVGIDIERVQGDIEAIDLADRFFSAAEAKWLHSQPVPERIGAFFACWTAKEAFLKMCGRGLSMPIAQFTVIPEAENELIKVETCEDYQNAGWIWQLNFDPSLRAAVAAQEKNLRIHIEKWVWPRELRKSKE